MPRPTTRSAASAVANPGRCILSTGIQQFLLSATGLLNLLTGNMETFYCTMFGKFLQPEAILKTEMHRKAFGDWAPIESIAAALHGRAGRAGRDKMVGRE